MMGTKPTSRRPLRMSLEMDNSRSGTSSGTDGEEDEGQERCMAPRVKIFLVTILSFAIASAVVMLVVLTRIEENSTPIHSSDDSCEDVAIIGAGLAGTYAAWRLRNTNLTVRVYEKSARVGGRFYSSRFENASDTRFELGAQYFIPALHPQVDSLTRRLGLRVVPYPDPSSRRSLFLRGRFVEEHEFTDGTSPYTMKDNEQGYQPQELLWRTLAGLIEDNVTTRWFRNNTDEDNNDDQLADTLNYNDKLDTLLLERLSYEAYHLVRDSLSPQDLIPEADPDVFWEYMTSLLHANRSKLTISGGMNLLPTQLLTQAITDNIKTSVDYNHKLMRMRDVSGVTELTFVHPEEEGGITENITTCAKSVLLTLQPNDILDLDWDEFISNPSLLSYLDSVTPIPVINVFGLYEDPLWDSNFTEWDSLCTDLPPGNMEDLGYSSSKERQVVKLIDTHRHIEYWESLLAGYTHDKEYSVMNDKLFNHINSYLSQVTSPTDNTPEPMSIIVCKWDGETQPVAWHVWKPGSDWSRIALRLQKPIRDQNVYLIGSTFSPGYLQLWGEGALTNTDAILQLYF